MGCRGKTESHIQAEPVSLASKKSMVPCKKTPCWLISSRLTKMTLTNTLQGEELLRGMTTSMFNTSCKQPLLNSLQVLQQLESLPLTYGK